MPSSMLTNQGLDRRFECPQARPTKFDVDRHRQEKPEHLLGELRQGESEEQGCWEFMFGSHDALEALMCE